MNFYMNSKMKINKQFFQKYSSWLKNVFFKHYVKGCYKTISDDHTFLMGGGLAFSLILCVLPLILLMFAVFGNILELTNFEQKISLFIHTLLPYKNATANIEKIIFDRIQEVKYYRNIAGILGLIGLLFTASGLFSSMRTILNDVYNVKKNSSMIVGKLRDLLMMLIVIIFFLLSTTILPIIEILKDNTDTIKFLQYIKINSLIKFMFSMASFVIIYWLFFILYYFIPFKKQPKNVVNISAFIASLFWALAAQLFGFYVSNFAYFGKLYGAYVFIIVIAFWIYYSSIVFILGAEIGELYKQRKYNTYHGDLLNE